MAASMLWGRTATLSRFFTGLFSPKTLISRNGFLIQTASYNPKPLKRNLQDPYIPDKDSEKTPEWQTTARYDRKLFGRYGSASGIEPASLWPSREQLQHIVAEEKQWHPPLEVMLKNVAAKEKEETERRLDREKRIAANMAKMPKMVADWRREKRESKQKLKRDKAYREKLVAEARERFGQKVDPRTPKFLEMVAEIEKEDRKKKKLMKRRLRQEQAAAAIAPPAAS